MSIKLENRSAAASGTRPLQRSLGSAMWHGAFGKCPACGAGSLYQGYLKVREQCADCGEELHHQRADDAPPYFTMLIVGHFVVGGVLALEQAYKPSPWVHAAIWLPVVLISSLWMLPKIKGALIGLQWALRMHGFGAPDGDGARIATISHPPKSTTS